MEMAEYQTQYQSLPSFDEDTDDNDVPMQDADVMIHVVPESSELSYSDTLKCEEIILRMY